jgi:hypothetical protein
LESDTESPIDNSALQGVHLASQTRFLSRRRIPGKYTFPCRGVYQLREIPQSNSGCVRVFLLHSSQYPLYAGTHLTSHAFVLYTSFLALPMPLCGGTLYDQVKYPPDKNSLINGHGSK